MKNKANSKTRLNKTKKKERDKQKIQARQILGENKLILSSEVSIQTFEE